MLDELKVAISENDIPKARRIMKTALLETNYPHEVFKDAMDLASAYSVFEEHDNKKLEKNPKEWNETYFEKVKEDLEENFSKERFVHAYYVARKVLDGIDEEKSCPIKLYDEYKDFFLLAQIGAAVVGATAVGVGILLYKLRKKK